MVTAKQAGSVVAVILTHAHPGHSGHIALACTRRIKGPIYCSEAARDPCAMLLPDSGGLPETDAERTSRHNYSKHNPALPLYTRVVL